MVNKSLNGLIPEYLSSKFVKRNETRYSLRDSVNITICPVSANWLHEKQFQL